MGQAKARGSKEERKAQAISEGRVKRNAKKGDLTQTQKIQKIAKDYVRKLTGGWIDE